MSSWVKISALVLLVCFVALWVLPHLPYTEATEQPHYKGIIDVWHVETFEGGNGSRANWLKARAQELEKKYSGLYFQITTLYYRQLTEKLSEGQTFDIISFSGGTGNAVLPYLVPYNGVLECYDNLQRSGEAEGVTYAVAYSAGMYALFARNKHLEMNSLQKETLSDNLFNCGVTLKQGKNTIVLDSMGVGFAAFNSPLSALSYKGIRGGAKYSDSVTQYSAYESYLTGKKFVALLGTQRDVNRLNARLEQSRTDPFVTVVLDSYTDLVQYLALGTSDAVKQSYCRMFIEHITSAESQKKLSYIGMLSVHGQCDHSDETLDIMENSLQHCVVPSVFESFEAITQRRNEAQQFVEGVAE